MLAILIRSNKVSVYCISSSGQIVCTALQIGSIGSVSVVAGGRILTSVISAVSLVLFYSPFETVDNGW